MAFTRIKSIAIKGVSACVPSKVEYNKDYPYYAEGELERMLPSIGVEKRHVIEPGTTCLELCEKAANKLLEELGWEKESINVLIYCSPARDYIFPDTACILQDKIGIPKSAMCFDMNLGCTGWVYSVNVAASIMSASKIKRALVLNGNLTTAENAFTDKTSYPLFSDAGTAMALEYDENSPDIIAELGTDGGGYDNIIIKDGGRRNPYTPESMVLKDYGENIKRSDMNMAMKGMEVFAFALNVAPKNVQNVMNAVGKTQEDIDQFFFHQANLFMVQRIAKKLKLPKEKIPFSIYEYGNTGACSIPLTMVTERADELRNNHVTNIGCAFGVGLSWGSIYFETNNLVIPELLLY